MQNWNISHNEVQLHAHQAKKSDYPKMRKLIFLDENIHFFVLGAL